MENVKLCRKQSGSLELSFFENDIKLELFILPICKRKTQQNLSYHEQK